MALKTVLIIGRLGTVWGLTGERMDISVSSAVGTSVEFWMTPAIQQSHCPALSLPLSCEDPKCTWGMTLAFFLAQGVAMRCGNEGCPLRCFGFDLSVGLQNDGHPSRHL